MSNKRRLPALGPDLLISAGEYEGISTVNKFGSNEDVSNGTEESVWDGGGTYSFPATALITKLSQTVDQVAMRGGTIEVQGLAAGYVLTVQTKALDAADTTTAVTLDTPLLRVFRMKVLEDIVNTSEIRAHNTAESVDYAIISIGNNQTLMAIYTVPAGVTAYMTNYYCDYVRSAARDPDSIEYRLWVADRDNGYEFQIKHKKGIPKQASGFRQGFNPYFKINEKNDIMITAEPSGAASDVHAGFDLILIENDI